MNGYVNETNLELIKLVVRDELWLDDKTAACLATAPPGALFAQIWSKIEKQRVECTVLRSPVVSLCGAFCSVAPSPRNDFSV